MMNLQENIQRIKEMMGTNKYLYDVKIPITDILPINSDGQNLKDAIMNVKDGLKSHSKYNPFLLKIGDKYEILDGFHRIAEKILDGKKYITADIKIY